MIIFSKLLNKNQIIILRNSYKKCISSSSNCTEIFKITGNFEHGKFLCQTVGSIAQVSHVFTQEEVNTFAELMGDNNPIHIDPVFAATTMFGGTIVHGIFVSSLFSTLFGRSIPGAIYVNQTVNFKRPVHVGKEVVATIQVQSVAKHKRGNLVTCRTSCKLGSDGSLVVDGHATVLVQEAEAVQS